MKKSKFIPLVVSAVLSLSMASMAVAGAASVPMTADSVVKNENGDTKDKEMKKEKKETGGKDKKTDSKEVLELFGRIKKVTKEGMEIETAVVEFEKEVSDNSDEKTEKKGDKKKDKITTNKKDDKKLEDKKEQKNNTAEKKETESKQTDAEEEQTDQDIIRLVLDGKTITIIFEKDIVYYKEVNVKADENVTNDNDKDVNQEKKDKKQTEDGEQNNAARKIIKQEELKENDIIKVTVEKGKAKEITVLDNAKILEVLEEMEDTEDVTNKNDKKADEVTEDNKAAEQKVN